MTSVLEFRMRLITYMKRDPKQGHPRFDRASRLLALNGIDMSWHLQTSYRRGSFTHAHNRIASVEGSYRILRRQASHDRIAPVSTTWGGRATLSAHGRFRDPPLGVNSTPSPPTCYTAPTEVASYSHMLIKPLCRLSFN